MHQAGFEPAHPEIVGLKSTALDHSAIDASTTHRYRSCALPFNEKEITIHYSDIAVISL